MKKNVSILMVVVMLLILCACGNKEMETNMTATEAQDTKNEQSEIEEQSKDALTNQHTDEIDEDDPNGYFRIKYMPVIDRWGEEESVNEWIIAVAEAHYTNGKPADPVTVYYNCGGYYSGDHYFFFVPGGNTNRYLNIKNLGFKIGSEAAQVVPKKDNYVTEDTENSVYELFKQEFLDGNDITFSAWPGDFIFTIHGEGFADLVKPD